MPTIEEFGQSIKKKYPQYQNIDDKELGTKFLQKYPEYQDRIFDTDPATQASIAQPKKDEGFLTRVVGDFKKRMGEQKENLDRTKSGQQGLASYVLQGAGHGAGFVGDIVGEGVKSIFKGVGKVAETVAPDTTKAVKQTSSEVGKKFLETEAGKAGLSAIQGGVDMYKQWAEKNPTESRNLEAVVDIASLFPILKGTKMAGEATLDIGKAAFNAAKTAKTAVGDVASVAKEKALSTRAGEAISEIVSPIDNVTKKTLDPFSSVPKENLAAIPKETIKKTKEAIAGKLDFYLNKARRAMQNPGEPSPLEFAGKKAEEVLTQLNDKLTRYGKMKKAETEKVKDMVMTGVPELRDKLMASLKERIGAEVKDGEFVPAAGRAIAVSDPADLKLIDIIEKRLGSLGDSPTFQQVDDTVDFLQDMLYKKKSNLAIPISGKVEGIMKQITGELNAKLRESGGKLYRKANQRLSGIIDVRDNLNKALGTEGSKGGSLMKRVFSPTDGGTKALFREIKRITGIDLNEEATLAKFAMEKSGDARQANLLEQLELIKGSLGASKGSFLVDAIKNIAQRAGKTVVGDEVDRARRILRK